VSNHILIKEIRGFGYHGVFDDERANGQEFLVDLDVELRDNKAGLSDDMNDGVDYSALISIAHKIIIGEPVNLIERVAEMIAEEILNTFPVLSVEVTVHKKDAPVSFPTSDIAVRILRIKPSK
jgi:dihydroneopterin aldolase